MSADFMRRRNFSNSTPAPGRHEHAAWGTSLNRISPPFGPAQRLLQEPLAKSQFVLREVPAFIAHIMMVLRWWCSFTSLLNWVLVPQRGSSTRHPDRRQTAPAASPRKASPSMNNLSSVRSFNCRRTAPSFPCEKFPGESVWHPSSPPCRTSPELTERSTTADACQPSRNSHRNRPS